MFRKESYMVKIKTVKGYEVMCAAARCCTLCSLFHRDGSHKREVVKFVYDPDEDTISFITIDPNMSYYVMYDRRSHEHKIVDSSDARKHVVVATVVEV